jgi:Caspase domain
VRFSLGLCALLIFLPTTHCVAAETRIALIIGNSDYANANLKLTNPANDAAAMQRALKAAGFETIVRLNAKRLDFYRAVDEFSARIGRDQHAVGLFYYAGHGVQADGTNYLIPVDADIQSEADLDANAFDAGRVLRAMKTAQNEMNIVILDACRDNPLPKTRGIERGLARMDAPSGTFIAYAAAPGQSAQDGTSGTNGVFTGELVKAMAEPGVPLEQMFKKVIAGVKADTHGGQQPWSEASIQGDFYFHAGESSPATRAQTTPTEPPAASHAQPPDEIAAYKAAEASNTVAGWQIFKRNYPNSAYASTADIRLATLAQPRAPAPVQRDAQPAPQAARSEVDPAVVGTFELDSVFDDYDQHAIVTIAADGHCRLVVTREENGTYQSAFGMFRTTAARTHRVRAGTLRAVGSNAIEISSPAGSVVFQPEQPGVTVNRINPVMLGTWHGSMVIAGINWSMTEQNSANGAFEFKAQTEDNGSCAYANNQWHTNSTVTGNSDAGTYRVIDARDVEFSGSQGSSVWKRR